MQTFAGVRVATDRKVDDHYYGIGAGAHVRHKLDETLSFLYGGGFNAFYREGSLWSRQTNECDVCAASEQNFTAEIEQEDTGFTWGAHAEVSLRYNYMGWGAGLTFGMSYIDERSAVRVRENPNQPPTHLASESAIDYYGRFAFRYNF